MLAYMYLMKQVYAFSLALLLLVGAIATVQTMQTADAKGNCVVSNKGGECNFNIKNVKDLDLDQNFKIIVQAQGSSAENVSKIVNDALQPIKNDIAQVQTDVNELGTKVTGLENSNATSGL